MDFKSSHRTSPSLYVFNISNQQFESRSNSTSNATPVDSLLDVFDVLYIVFGIFGVFGNATSFAVLITYKPLRRKLHNLFLISHCLLNLLYCILLAPTKIPVYSSTNIPLCYLWQAPIIRAGLYISSVYNIAALALERYLEVVHPFKHKLFATRTRVLCFLAGVWIFGLLAKAAVIYPGTKITGGICVYAKAYSSTMVAHGAGLLNILVEYCVPLIIIICSYTSMRLSLRRAIHPGFKDVAAQSKTTHLTRARRNIFITLIIVVTTFVVCTTSRQVVLFLFFLEIRPLDNSGVFGVAELVACSSCCIYPYICFCKHDEFKRGFRSLFCPQRHADKSSISVMSPAPPAIAAIASTQ